MDAEFTGLHANATLISIALVSNCGAKFYAEFCDYDKSQLERMGCKEEVLNNLLYNEYKEYTDFSFESPVSMKDKTTFISVRLIEWLKQFDEIEIVGDCMSWDWVLFCDLFGGAFKIPQNVYYIPFDIANLFKIKNINPDISRVEYLGGIDSLTFEYKEHNALTDAKVCLNCYNKLMDSQ